MRKITLLFFSLLIAFGAIAQKSKVRTAYMQWQSKDYDKAVENIEIGIKDPKAAADAKSWYYRGIIYQTVYEEREKYPELAEGALEKSYKSYMKALELDEKGKDSEQIVTLRLDPLRVAFAVRGDKLRDEDRWKEAYDSYTRAGELNELIMKELGSDVMPMDTTVLFLRGYTAERAENIPQALEIYNSLVDMNYELPLLYQATSRIYITNENYDEALRVLKSGQAIFPDNNDLLIDELNIYLATGKQDDAIDRFRQAVKLDPKNPDLHFALGSIYDKMRDSEEISPEKRKEYKNEMVDAYKAALAADDQHFKANYNLGVMYFNEAVEISKEMNNLPLSAKKEYENLKAQRNELFMQARPYLEQAHEVNPVDRDTMTALKEIYFRTGAQEKYNEINEKMKG